MQNVGSQLFMLDVNGMMRRCGGRWSCAAFSERFSEEDAQLEEADRIEQKHASELAEVAGRQLYNAFMDEVRKANRA